MSVKIENEPRSIGEFAEQVKHKFWRDEANGLAHYFRDGHTWDTGSPRAPFKYALQRDDKGAICYGGSNTGVLLLEVTGRACAAIKDLSAWQHIINSAPGQITRIDICTDIDTQARPTDFSNARTKRTGRAMSYIASVTGETVYLGSIKSDRYCRVYRYNPPHPRAKYLRIEHCYKKRYIEPALTVITEAKSWKQIAAATAKEFGWEHPSWRPELTEHSDLAITSPAISRNESQTLHWLYHQVAPAIVRGVQEGWLDWHEFLDHLAQKTEGQYTDNVHP